MGTVYPSHGHSIEEDQSWGRTSTSRGFPRPAEFVGEDTVFDEPANLLGPQNMEATENQSLVGRQAMTTTVVPIVTVFTVWGLGLCTLFGQRAPAPLPPAPGEEGNWRYWWKRGITEHPGVLSLTVLGMEQEGFESNVKWKCLNEHDPGFNYWNRSLS